MFRVLIGIAFCGLMLCRPCFAQALPELKIPVIADDINQLSFPRITVTAVELDRLQSALNGDDVSAKRIVTAKIREADLAIDSELTFPVRGGQHNQWYQCETCQLSLKTIDLIHHQCPKCKKVYSGEPYDDVMYSRKHSDNLKEMLAAAWAHALTGEQRYAEFSAKVLLGYATRYREYPYHTASRDKDLKNKRAGGHLFEQTLTEASAFATYIGPAYDLVRASQILTPEQDQQIRDGLLRPMLENIGKYPVGKSNWQTWHNAAMLAGGALLGEKEWVERAISDPRNGFFHQMKVSVSAEGMWYENSWAYHFYTLRAMIHIAEYSRRMNIDLWSHPTFQSMFTIAPEYAMPGGLLPRFGDDVNSRLASASSSLEFAFHALRLKSLEAVLSGSPTWDSIMLGRAVDKSHPVNVLESKLFPAAGHAIIRTGKPNGLSSVITFGPYGGFHGHFDKLSFVFFGLGKELGVDPGRARSQAYRLPIHTNWYKATISHNAVVVNQQSQSPASGQLLLFNSTQSHSAAIARCVDAYPGVQQTRLLFQTSDYLVVFDDLQSDQNNRFDWLYHNRANSIQCDVAKKDAAPEPNFLGMEYVRNARVGSTNQSVTAAFISKNISTHLTLDARADTEVLIGDGVGGSVMERIPLIRVTRHGKSARFAAVLEPVREDGPTVNTVNWKEQGDGSILISVNRDGRTDLIQITADWKQVVFNPASLNSQR
ncbi:MAG: hypothetical protein ACI814_000356 [Mariniblastus sp.]|jgi:hypothetical protein